MSGPGLQPLSKAHATADRSDMPIDRWLRPFVRFFLIKSARGIVLLLCTVAALALANSPWADGFAGIWQTRIAIAVGTFELSKPLLLWINDGFMTIFFFVVGLEIKRELVAGELRDPKKAALPVMAALGGMIAPASIYLLLQHGRPGEPGWGIPMATDIAFVVGFLALLGQRVPLGLKILLLSIAIADDIGAILVIAVFYSSNISFAFLALAGLGFGVVILFNTIGVRRVPVYVIVGAVIWITFLKSGVHPTVAGVVMGLLTPAVALVGEKTVLTAMHAATDRLNGEPNGDIEYHQQPLLGELQYAAREAVSPLDRLEKTLHPWVAFGIMPIFAFANAGVTIDVGAVAHPISLATAAGLVIGKPAGILLFSWLAVTLRLARLPTGVNWRIMLGAGCLAGIGFTMSLFIASLALKEDLLDAGKIGTLTGSTLSAILGSTLLIAFLPKRSRALAIPAQEKLTRTNG